MAYNPTNWQTGDVVTSAKLNKIEDGIANSGAVLCLRPTYENRTLTLDKTYKEIFDAVSGGTFVFIVFPSIDDNYEVVEGICETRYVESVGYSDDEYYVYSAAFNYTAQTEDDYPSATLE